MTIEDLLLNLAYVTSQLREAADDNYRLRQEVQRLSIAVQEAMPKPQPPLGPVAEPPFRPAQPDPITLS